MNSGLKFCNVECRSFTYHSNHSAAAGMKLGGKLRLTTHHIKPDVAQFVTKTEHNL